FGEVAFLKLGTTTLSITGGSITNKINWDPYTGNTLDMGTSIVTGTGYFMLWTGATLKMGDPKGISNDNNTGNVQVTGTKTFSKTASYVYNGTAAQVEGNALPDTVTNLTCSNAAGLTLQQGSVVVTGTLAFTSGIITTANSNELGVSNTSTTAVTGYS